MDVSGGAGGCCVVCFVVGILDSNIVQIQRCNSTLLYYQVTSQQRIQ